MSDWKDKKNAYLSDARYFPWQWFGGVPTIGPTHTYLLKILIGYISPNFRTFAAGSPSFRELFRVYDDMRLGLLEKDSVLMDVCKYCEVLENEYSHYRKPRRVEVLDYLKKSGPFLQDFEKMVKKDEGLSVHAD